MTSAVATVLAVCAAPTAAAGATVQDVGAPAAPVSYDSGLAPTPYMGWNTYYGLGAPTEEAVRGVADKLVASGLRDSGYDIVWLDGGWQADNLRDAQARLVANPDRFPSGIPALVSYLHRRGLRAGIYTDMPAPTTAARAAAWAAAATTTRTHGSSRTGRSTRSRSTSCAESVPSLIRARRSRSSATRSPSPAARCC